MPKISCIIPAYNEEPRIAAVLEVVHGHPLIDEIIVVDDGSKDNTKDIVKKFDGVLLLVNEINKGKSYSVARGIIQAKGDIIVMLDADLIGLTRENISELIEPVLSGRADVSISLRNNAIWLYRKIGLDLISGERVFPKKLVEDYLKEIENLSCYGLEVNLNKLIIKNNCRIKIVFWKNVSFAWKEKKLGLLAGIKSDVLMQFEVLRNVSVFGALGQIIKMSSLRVK